MAALMMTTSHTHLPSGHMLHNSPAQSGNDMMRTGTECKRFRPNIFTPSKCQECFRQKSVHTAEALAENRAARKVCKCGYLFVAPPDYDCKNPAHRARRWQQRWFMLFDDGELTFALDNNGHTVPQAVVDMSRIKDVADAGDVTGHENSLLLCGPSQDYFIKASSKEEIRWWYDVLVMYPRSMQFSKQQRAGQQRRSRTLPNNALSQQQLTALRTDCAPDVIAQSSAAARKSDELSSPVPFSATLRDGDTPPANSPVPSQHQLVTQVALVSTNPLLRTAHSPVDTQMNYTNAASRNPKRNGGVSCSFLEPPPPPIPLYAKDVPTETDQGKFLSRQQNIVALEERERGTFCQKEASSTEYLKDQKGKMLSAVVPPQAAVDRKRSLPGNIRTLPYSDPYPNENGKNWRPDKRSDRAGENMVPVNGTATSMDSFTDTDLSTDSEEVSSVANGIFQDRTEPANEKSQRLVFTPLSRKDMEDVVQLQRIMGKKSINSTGSTSSCSSGSSNESSRGLLTLSHLPAAEIPPPPPSIPPQPNQTVQARSPPINRTALSRAKDRSRFRSRSKSPQTGQGQTPVGNNQRTLVIDGNIRYEDVVKSPANAQRTAPTKTQGRQCSRENAKQSEGGPRSVKSSRSLVVSLPRRPWSDQSTQISLDVRHYETMVSNLEKRLLDRELLVREMSQKMQTMQTDHKRKCDQDPRVKALEMQLSDLTSSYNEMALVKDSLLNTSRQETTCLRKKLMEAENLLLSALQMEEETGERSPPASIVSTDSPPSGPVTDDVQQIGRKLLAAFKEIRGLRKENVALNDQIGEMNAEYADLKEQIESMKLEEEREKEEVGVQTEEKDSLLHADCHKTVEALHYEISSLQNRLHAQDAQHSEESIQIKGLLREMDGLKREAVDLLMVTEEVSHLHDGHGGKHLVKDHVKEMHAIYHKSMLTAQAVHAQQLQDMECRHKQEMNFLMENREQEMVEETKATKAALELLRQSYEDSLALERKRLISFFSSMTGPFSASAVQSDPFAPIRQKIEDLWLRFESVEEARESAEKYRLARRELEERQLQIKDYHQHLAAVIDRYQPHIHP